MFVFYLCCIIKGGMHVSIAIRIRNPLYGLYCRYIQDMTGKRGSDAIGITAGDRGEQLLPD